MKILAILMLLSLTAQAEYLDINLTSKHTGTRSNGAQYKEDNFGLGYWNEDYTVGWFNNSYNKTSVYAGIVKEVHLFKYTEVGVILGGVTGYKEQSGYTIMPLVLPFVAVGTGKLRVRLGLLPAVVTLTLQVGF